MRKSTTSTLQTEFWDLEKKGLNPTLSAMAQNIIEYGGTEAQKERLIYKTKQFQPEWSAAISKRIEK